MKLGFRVKVVFETFAFEPSEESPFGRGQMAGGAPFDRIRHDLVFGNEVDRLGAFEREGRVVVGVVGLARSDRDTASVPAARSPWASAEADPD